MKLEVRLKRYFVKVIQMWRIKNAKGAKRCSCFLLQEQFTHILDLVDEKRVLASTVTKDIAEMQNITKIRKHAEIMKFYFNLDHFPSEMGTNHQYKSVSTVFSTAQFTLFTAIYLKIPVCSSRPKEVNWSNFCQNPDKKVQIYFTEL